MREPVFDKQLKAIANVQRLLILDWLKDPTRHFRPQVDGDLVEDDAAVDDHREAIVADAHAGGGGGISDAGSTEGGGGGIGDAGNAEGGGGGGIVGGGGVDTAELTRER